MAKKKRKATSARRKSATARKKTAKKKARAKKKKKKKKTGTGEKTKKRVTKKAKNKAAKTKKAKKRTAKKGRASTKKKKTASKRTKRRSRAQSAPAVRIVSDAGEVLVESGSDLQQLAMRWRYVLSRRQRWRHSSRVEMRDQAHKALNELVTPSASKEALGGAHIVEVQVPYRNEEIGWEGRVAPWEYLISAAAMGAGNETPLTIVRWLDTGRNSLLRDDGLELKVLYVQCSPGQLADFYDFASERRMLERIFPQVVPCINPTLADLRQAITRHQPNVIHIAGIDNNQAKELLEDEGDLPENWISDREQDGVVLSSGDPSYLLGMEPISADTLARVLNSGSEPLQLVAANVYHSASRICALAVAEGASLAFGFQDTVKDSLAEVVLREFYTSWKEERDPLTAFVGAINVARSSVSLSGTGIVLWSERSLLDDAVERIQRSRQERETDRDQVIELEDNYSSWFNVDIKVRERLNYSLLHNDSGGLFETLEFRKERDGILRDVGVEAVLYLGSESHPYHATFTLTDYLTPVDRHIKVPLTSSIMRTVGEPMRTSLHVRVTVKGRVIEENTFRVTLLPADEWKDNDADRIWLPSFVLPRDPAIEQIVERAQKHLITLADDHTRGFDGYQSIELENPETLADVDLQVQAIWAAVVSDFGIRYINPPPSYSRLGQRLRTPTQILRGGRGTCIDLALLFCACLEYVEIYPVIFLLEGHAFAGYWRSEDRYDAFTEGRQEGIEDATMLESIGSTAERSPWILPSDSYAEVLNEVNSGFLYPIETVGFTTHGSFWEAIEEGVDNLRSRSEFHSLIDIWLARSEFITPLPIIEELVHFRGSRDHD